MAVLTPEQIAALNAEQADFVECWQCNGLGILAGCFEDTCSGADCDPEEAEYCCAPSRCDVCNGNGSYPPAPPEPAANT